MNVDPGESSRRYAGAANLLIVAVNEWVRRTVGRLRIRKKVIANCKMQIEHCKLRRALKLMRCSGLYAGRATASDGQDRRR
jgi:hypothetical protein